MKLQKDAVIRKLGGSYVVNRLDSKTNQRSMMTLNDTAAFLWKALSDCDSFSVKDLTDALVAEYEIEAEIANADVTAMLAKWKEGGFVVSE